MAEVLPVFLSLSASVFLSGHLPAPSVCGASSLAQRLGQDLMTGRNPRDCTGKGAETVASFLSLPITVTAYVFGLLIAGADVGDTSEWQGT